LAARGSASPAAGGENLFATLLLAAARLTVLLVYEIRRGRQLLGSYPRDFCQGGTGPGGASLGARVGMASVGNASSAMKAARATARTTRQRSPTQGEGE
jgi:hypothetical protein